MKLPNYGIVLFSIKIIKKLIFIRIINPENINQKMKKTWNFHVFYDIVLRRRERHRHMGNIKKNVYMEKIIQNENLKKKVDFWEMVKITLVDRAGGDSDNGPIFTSGIYNHKSWEKIQQKKSENWLV